MASRRESAPGGSRKSSGRVIGHFTIDKEIGKGSFATVYMGFHKVLSVPQPPLIVCLELTQQTGDKGSRCNQVGRSRALEQKAERQPLWRNPDPQNPQTSSHRRSA
jgi:hypothetical protein